MKKLLIIIPSVASSGGAEKLVDSLVRLLLGKYDVSVASFDPPGTQSYFKNGASFYPLGETLRLPLTLRVVTYISAAHKVAALKRALGIEVAISVLWRADLINVLSAAREKIISLAVINILKNDTNSLMVHFRAIVGLVFRRFDRILAITPDIATELLYLYKLNPVKVGTFNTFLATPSKNRIFNDGRPRFVFCGRAVQEKNIDGLLYVFAAFSCRNLGYQLVVIGDGPLLTAMKSLATELGLSVSNEVNSSAQVLFVGSSVSPESLMWGARAFLLTSRHEGVPTVAILAAALGLPILAADCHGGGMRVLFGLSADAPLLEPDDEAGPSAGLLLPIPDVNLPATLEVWVRGMELADRSQGQRDKWVRGALKLAADRSPESVRMEWITIIESVVAE